MCIDYRKLNALTILEKFPIPLIDILFLQLKNANYFTKLDAKSSAFLLTPSALRSTATLNNRPCAAGLIHRKNKRDSSVSTEATRVPGCCNKNRGLVYYKNSGLITHSDRVSYKYINPIPTYAIDIKQNAASIKLNLFFDNTV